jgi:Sec-independent protein translocase protein TatA
MLKTLFFGSAAKTAAKNANKSFSDAIKSANDTGQEIGELRKKLKEIQKEIRSEFSNDENPVNVSSTEKVRLSQPDKDRQSKPSFAKGLEDEAIPQGH